ncbi:hypothetical protein MKK63_24380 [Methylobacterium sp. J-088]|uniref:hypothetical protein n=1 Tax=Methylobacterium sp. J-088 TaxID=2836664 RepID=UPI001FB9DA44|nr:hypothetical protein [Methylobacterium sp. J-088]MCJ2065818.1 hypothetical protein [Methylobacterium sp. J-088]
MIPAADAWGPFRGDIDPAERKARLRCLRAVVHLSTGPRGQALADLLLRAEQDAGLLPSTLAALSDLDPLDKRRVWASYLALNRPAA